VRFHGLSSLGVVAAAAVVAVAASAAEPGVTASDLPRVQATEPDAALATIQVRPGFHMELMAAEPRVTSPVAMAFDEAGRIYVVEMRDYSERRPEKLGRIRLLEDTDGDGRPDKATVFLDGIPWPTAVICWRGGVFLGATPDLVYAKDTDGDGVADVRETVFTGFASDYAPYATNRLNVQALMNSLQWGVDNRIHGAGSVSGGTVRRVPGGFVDAWVKTGGGNPESKPMTLGGRNFSFDPRTLDLVAETGGGQHGMSFDDVGHAFVCSNSDHLQWVAYDAESVPANPFHSLPAPRHSIALDGPSAEVFRRSPDEPWRVLRTRWRVAGLVEGPVEGGGRPSGYFTGATGTTVHRGDAAGEAAGDAFIADCGSNLIHRKRLRRDGFVLSGARVADEARSEFAASTDNWFRPVQFANAPDGCLWVVDMYRETIEHPWSLPPGLKRHLDLDSGRDRGRLWRIVPDGLQPRRGPLPFATADAAGLVALLGHPNGWHRDTAARLLVERGGTNSSGVLSGQVEKATNPASRIQALHTLSSLGGLTAERLADCLADASPAVREHAVRLARLRLAGPSNLAAVVARRIGVETAPAVLWELGLAAAGLPDKARIEAVQRLALNESDWVRSAAVHASRGVETALLERLAREPASSARGDSMADVAGVIGRSGDVGLQRRAVELLSALEPESLRFRVAAALASESRSSPAFRDSPGWRTLVGAAVLRAHSTDSAVPEALRLLPEAGESSVATLFAHLGSAALAENRAAALASLGRLPGRAWSPVVVGGWSGLAPAVRPTLVAMLVRRPETARTLLDAVEEGRVPAPEIDLGSVGALRNSSDAVVKARARTLFGEPPASRGEAVAAFLPSLQMAGNAAHGAKVFTERCATCHRLGSVGAVLGPDLASVRSNGKEKILVSILDPNREVSPAFVSWTAETTDGSTWSGILVREDAAAVVLKIAGGTETSMARSDLKRLTRSDRSLMPEGLESGLTQQDLADLLEHIVTAR